MERPMFARTAAGLVVTVLALVLAAAPAGAQSFGSETLPLKSDNVTPLATIPLGKPVGARFRDQFMYVTGTDGLSVYDVSNPALPVPAGFLPLPHFENEDVDLGGDILLISNDPSETVGVLYVIDISDPHLPVLKSEMINGFGDGQAQDALAIFGIPEVPGSPETGIGHTASCIKADCSWAYLAGTSKGISIVDLRDPAKPVVAGRFVPDITGLASHDVQVDGDGIAWIVGADGTAGYDVTDPLHPVQVARSDEKIVNSGQLGIPSLPDDPIFHFGDVIGGEGETPIDLIHHDSLRLGTVYKPAPGQTPAGGGGAGGGSAPERSTTITVPEDTAPGQVKKRKSARARAIKHCKRTKKGKARKRCIRRAKKRYAPRASSRAAGGGSLTLEPFRQVAGKAYPAGGDSPLFGIVEEDYNRPTCKGAGSFQLWGMTDEKTSKGAAKLGLLDLYTTELDKLLTDQSGWAPVTGLCSAHYFDYRDGIVAGGWYEEGTRFLDVRDPSDIKQVGYWVPSKGETWSVVFPPTDPTGSIVYALDFARGIDVLRLDRSDLKERRAPVRKSWLRKGKGGLASGQTSRTGLTTSGRYGYLCRLAVPSV
jgi:hypothetical protein